MTLYVPPYSRRISITLSEEELSLWKKYAGSQSLSSFIRKAVNEYIKIHEPHRKETFLELFIEQKKELSEIKKKLSRLEKIEDDIIDITHALAKFEMIVPIEKNGDIVWEIKKKDRNK